MSKTRDEHGENNIGYIRLGPSVIVLFVTTNNFDSTYLWPLR